MSATKSSRGPATKVRGVLSSWLTFEKSRLCEISRVHRQDNVPLLDPEPLALQCVDARLRTISQQRDRMQAAVEV
jgi:hypothetical protein